MDELRCGDEFRQPLHLFLEPVFDCFDIMIGGGLDCLDSLSIFLAEVIFYTREHRFGFRTKRLQLVKPRLSERH